MEYVEELLTDAGS